MNAKIKDWKDWIKKQSARLKERTIQRTLAIWKKTTFLKTAYIGVALFILYYLIKIFLNLRDQLFTDITKLDPEEMRNLALAFLGTVSGIGALFGVYLAILRSETNERQTVTAEEGLITDRINKAIEGLGKGSKEDPVIEVRLGALYALERIAQDSIRDHVQIMEILCAYVRYNSPKTDEEQIEDKKDTEDEDEDEEENLLLAYLTGKKRYEPFKPASFFAVEPEPEIDPLREDIQTALTIIGRRDKWPNAKKYLENENKNGYKIDLSYCNLRGMVLKNANMSDAQFQNTDMTGADLYIVNMRGANFTQANMSNMNNFLTDMGDAKTLNAFAWKGSFRVCIDLFENQVDEMFLGRRVTLPDDVKHPQKHVIGFYKDYKTFSTFMKARNRWKTMQGIKSYRQHILDSKSKSKKSTKDEKDKK